MIQFRRELKMDKKAAVVFITHDQARKKRLGHIKNKKVQAKLLELINDKQFDGSCGQVFPIVSQKKVLLAAGLGKETELTATFLRAAFKRTFCSGYLSRASDIEVQGHNQDDDTTLALIDACTIGTYRWLKYKKGDNGAENKHKNLILVTPRKKVFDNAITISEGVNLARDLVNDNADTVTSTYFEKTIKRITKNAKNINIEILNKSQLTKKGLNLHLAVNQGSKKEPKLIIVKYKGASASEPYTALIGKGMTFDTGGLNLKPTGYIENMRCDMSGAAAVVGTLKNCVSLRVKKNLILACGLAENVTGSQSYKPGDVFKSYSGKTVEIGNTDAEGRLVLADAIAYIVRNYKPERVIDIATLTGACVVALGHDFTGLVSNDDKMALGLLESAEKSNDRAWRLPMYPELKTSVSSQIADIRNLGFPKGAAGTITAAEFLRQFTDDTRWAHLDIAGTAFNDAKERHYYNHGATGAGVRLLTHYIAHS